MPAQTIHRSVWSINPFSFRRRPTRVVPVGNVLVGGSNPIRIQSMTTTPTMDTEATVAQVLRLARAGCEIARITAPTILEAQNLENIKKSLLQKGCEIPLVADIHFRPDAALVAADFVEKVRINPGNFTDGKAFKIREYTEDQYGAELRRIEQKFTPLVLKLKRLKRALRIGTNHGSLSDRIMNRFGDTPLGMVESALEFVRICQKNDFHDIILSMKASNPRVMVEAYRLLASRMAEEDMDYPFHLGVTEAGDGPDGRIKSAAGIGSLLEDGIGDTIRVSLTEEPEAEIPVAQELAERYTKKDFSSTEETLDVSYVDPAGPARRPSRVVKTGPIELGGSAPIRVVSPVVLAPSGAHELLRLLEDRLKKDAPPEIIEIGYQPNPAFPSLYQSFRSTLAPETSRLAFWLSFEEGKLPAQLPPADGYVYRCGDRFEPREIESLNSACGPKGVLVLRSSSVLTLVSMLGLKVLEGRMVVACLDPGSSTQTVHSLRLLAAALRRAGSDVPILLASNGEDPDLAVAIVQGSLICDGIGDAVSVCRGPASRDRLDFAYNLLQACGSRLTKTEFVSCPSCGRTLFDLQSTTERIKSKTGHLKGIKIAIMGCIVNGPGEMADADFGYVGGGPGKINLYVGKNCVEKSIPSEVADEKLVELIRQHGKWVDPLS